MNKGFFFRGFLQGFLLGGFVEKIILCNLQSMDGLCFSNQERPRITGFDIVLIILITIRLIWSLNATSIDFYSWVTLSDNKGHPSMTSIWTGLDFCTKGILCRFANSWTKKQANALQSNNAKVFNFWGLINKRIVKQKAGWVERKEPDCYWDISLSSRTVPIVAGHPFFLEQICLWSWQCLDFAFWDSS